MIRLNFESILLLNAGFRADNGTVFKTEFGGCN